MEEKFSALIIAVQSGHMDIARKIFDLSMEETRNNTIDQAVAIADGTGYVKLGKAISKLKVKNIPGN